MSHTTPSEPAGRGRNSRPDAAPARGFGEPVADAAHAFRAVLDAMARPGTIGPIDPAPDAPSGLLPAMAGVMLTLCDTDTPVFLDSDIDNNEVRAFLAFHTGAPFADGGDRAAFVFAVRPPSLVALAQGTDEYPDRSTTLVLEVANLAGDGVWLSGPGIDGEKAFGTSLFTGDFLADWAANNRRFPRGVDIVLTCGERLAALPRTTRIREG